MKQYLKKSSTNEILDIDDKSRRVKVVIAKAGNLDLDGDIIEKSAFTKTIKERGPKGANQIWHLTDHNPSLDKALGKFSEIYMEGDNLVAVNESIVKNPHGDAILALYKDGHITEHSIGFSIPEGKTETKNGTRYIKEVMLWEGSAVTWGANPETPTLSVGKTIEEIRSMESAKLSERIEKILLALHSGQCSKDDIDLLTIEFKLLQSELTTQPEPSTEPEDEKELEKTIFLTLFKRL